MMTPIACTIAGSDSSGGAGIQADLKTFFAHQVYGASVVTCLTAQNTREISGIFPVSAAFVRQQVDAVFSDLTIGAVKIGMVGNADVMEALAERLVFWKNRQKFFLTIDPVLKASTGKSLLEEGHLGILRDRLLPLADLVTPNLDEAAQLLGCTVAASELEMKQQAQRLMSLGARFVLLTGGHMAGNEVKDFLYDGRDMVGFTAQKVHTSNNHGTGCTLSAAITAEIARKKSLVSAIEAAKIYVTQSLIGADKLSVGTGNGPLHHGYFMG